MSCLSLFLATSARRPQHPALVQGRRVVTYAELRAQGEACARRLAGSGIGAGDRVVVLIPLSVDLYAWILGLLALDAVVMFVEPWMPLGAIADCVRRAQPRAILTSPAGALLARRVPALRAIPTRLVTRWAPLLAPLGWRAPAADGPAPGVARAAATDPAVLTFTTGSSGVPKGVVRTHGLLLGQHQALTAALALQPTDVCLHTFANFILNNLALGATSVIPRIPAAAPTAFSAGALVGQLVRDRVSSLVCPPAALERLVGYCEQREITLPRVRVLGTGGGPVPARLLERAARSFPGADPTVLYGSSEVEPVSHIGWRELDGLRGEGICVGRPVPGLALRLLAPLGEIAVSAEHMSPRYFDDPLAMAATKLTDGDGRLWHRMGDTGRLDVAGRLWLTGRVQSVIQAAAGPVFPLPLEREAETAPFVGRAAVVGFGHPGDEEVVLAVEPRPEPGARADWERELRARVPRADRVVFLPQIPRDRRHRAKTDYHRLRALMETGS